MTVDRAGVGFTVDIISINFNAPKVNFGRYSSIPGMNVLQLTEATDLVKRFEFIDNEKDFDILKLSIENSSLEFLDSPVFAQGNLVRFTFGYPGRTTKPNTFVIDSIQGFETLTVICKEQSSTVNKEKNKLHKNTTIRKLLRDLVKNNLQLKVNDFVLDKSFLLDIREEFTQASESDWLFLKRLAEERGFEFYIENETLHFHRRLLGQTPKKKYTWYYGDGDLIEFEIKQSGSTSIPGKTTLAGYDPIEKKAVIATGSNETTERETLGSKGNIHYVIDQTTGELVSATRIKPTEKNSMAGVKGKADAQFRKAEQSQIKTEATIIGDPLLKAKTVIEIDGLGRTYSGKYYVVSHRHVISPSQGYVGQLELLKNGLAQSQHANDSGAIDPTKGKENTKQTPANTRQLKIKVDSRTGELYQSRDTD